MRLRRDPDKGKGTGSTSFGDRVPPRKPQQKTERPSAPASPNTIKPPQELLTAIANSRPWYSRDWLLVLALAAATFLAYWPCLHGDFVWDDDAWTLKLRGLYQSADGLGRIWTDLTALQQYYPLTATSFWMDFHLWGFWTLPYHVENILLHLCGAVLFWKLLRRLNVPGAGLAGGVLALHPIMVESVGWITERKNVLSLVLYLGALHCYGRFANFWGNTEESEAATEISGNKWRYYCWAVFLFLGAYLAKATAFSLPAVLLLICWWKRGHWRVRRDVLPTVPFWGMSIGLGLLTSWLERTHVGARGPDWEISFAERCLIAGRALWFYVGKLLWPVDLCFIYPRWQLDARAVGQWLWPAATLLAILMVWMARRRTGRGPLTAVLFFAGTLFPLLGFFNGYFMKYSFVCDHWIYLPSLGLIALGAALIVQLGQRGNMPGFLNSFTAMLLLVLAIQTRRHSAIFTDSETLYRTTLALNPNADLAHNNLGLLLAQEGQVEDAIPYFQKAVELRPNSAHAHNNLANAFRVTGRPRLAAEQYELSLKLDPSNANTLNNLALLFSTSADESVRNGPRGIELAHRAEELTQGRNPVVLATLAAAYAEAGQFTNAVVTLQQAIELSPPNSPVKQPLEAQLDLYRKGLPFRESN